MRLNLIGRFTFAFTLLFASITFSVGCASAGKSDSVNHQATLKKFSANAKSYDGFNQVFEIDVTLINSEVNQALLDQRSEFSGWDQETLRQEREKSFQEMSSYSKAFISFFSPENDYDDLHKPNSIWKIYLDVNGQRYEGRVKKDTSKHAELRRLYPYIDRFRTAYMVTFEVPVTAVEKYNSTMVMTSSIGSANFQFPPASSN